ncbi:MAG: argininosuccinate lyase [Chloroflexi bacterium]|nr:argininosuccinate lyase [Chloroflexota bacterium]
MTEYTTHHFQAASTYTVSVGYDKRLYPYDIDGSMAHARMLGHQGIISQADAGAIVGGLEGVRREIEEGLFPWRDDLEDLHMNIEVRLHELIGAPAGRLHTARSRNDQVATATRMFVRDAVANAQTALRGVQDALLGIAERHKDAVMPGYTHLQRAQPVLFAHHMLAYFEMFDRDIERFADCGRRANVLPLGSGALAGVPYPLDREWVAKELGFDSISTNSMDAVADRDYVLEFLAAAATTMMHTSRLAEETVLWTSQEFGFLRLGREWVTGSSIMPQKRNPDFAEIARGKTGRVYGSLMGLLTTMKGLPLTYNRDLQEDKEGIFDTYDTLIATLEAFAGMMQTAEVNEARMQVAAEDSSLLATDMADYLVAKDIPFREAHGIVSTLIDIAADRKTTIAELSISEFKAQSLAFEEDVYEVTALASATARDVPGGTAPKRVAEAMAEARARLAAREAQA